MIYIAIDTGTTNTTVWLVNNGRILSRLRHPIGVRNTSIAGDCSLLTRTLKQSLLSIANHAPKRPRFVLAAGMITSSLGFLEVPHVLAPAGAEKLSQHVRMATFPAISPLPFFLVPGVRINRAPCTLDDVEQTDIIRGEETEIVGLLARRNSRRLPLPWLFLHLGSHTKAIGIDKRGQIVRSVSTLSGECLQLLRTQTVLAQRLARFAPSKLQWRFFDRGLQCAKRHGLLRALFMVRLLGENRSHNQAQLYSFLLGTLLGNDLYAFERRGLLRFKRKPILLSGRPELQAAWARMLRRQGHRIEVVRPEERDRTFLKGLREIVSASPPFHRFLKRDRVQL